MADDQLRMVAEVVDKFSGPLRELQKLLKGTNAEQGRQAREQREAAQALRRDNEQLARSLTELVKPALGGVGLASLSAVGALTAMGRAAVGFADSARTFRIISQETGISIQNLRTLNAVAKTVDIAPEEMQSAVRKLALNFELAKRQAGDLYTALSQHIETLPLLEEVRRAKDPMEAFIRLVDGIKKLNIAPEFKALIAREAGIPEALIQITGTMREETEKWRGHIAKMTKESVENAEKFKLAWQDTQQVFENLTNAIGAVALPPLTAAMSVFLDQLLRAQQLSGQLAEDLNKGNLKEFLFGRDRPVTEKERGSRWDPDRQPTDEDTKPFYGRTPKNLHKMSYSPEDTGTTMVGGGRFRVAVPSSGAPAIHTTFQDDETKRTIATGTETGVLSAFRQFFGAEGGAGGGGGGGGMTGEGVFGGGGMIGAASFGGVGGGAGAVGGFRPSRGRNPAIGGFRPRRGGGGGAVGDDNAGEGLAGSAYLKARRERFAKEFADNPKVKQDLAAIVSMEHESDPTAVTESLMNRMDASHRTIESGIGGGAHSFYGPVRHGLVPGRLRELQRNPKRLARIMAGIDAALEGSNLIHGATDQGSGNDPNVAWQGGRIVRHGEVYNDWGGGPGHEGNRRFREAQEARVKAEQRSQGDLLEAARSNSVAAPGAAKIEGGASLSIDMRGLPKSARTNVDTFGNAFDDVRLNRGKTMQPSQD